MLCILFMIVLWQAGNPGVMFDEIYETSNHKSV
jgi:hypothetical protein